MATTSEVPITIPDDAREWIAQVGMQKEFELMLEHTRQTVPGLQAIEVELDPDPSCTIGPGIVIVAHRDHPGPGDDPTNRLWGRWLVETFSPQVCVNFVMLSSYGAPENGRQSLSGRS